MGKNIHKRSCGEIMKEIILKSLSEIKSNYANIGNSGLKTIIMPNINMNKPEMSLFYPVSL